MTAAVAFMTAPGARADDAAPTEAVPEAAAEEPSDAAPPPAAAPAAAPPTKAEITVVVSGLENSEGNVRIGIFTGKKGFPSKDDSLLVRKTAAIKDGKATVVFKDVPFGEYAIAAHHDENKNGAIDTNFFGLPKEGYGVSRDATGTLGPPDYDDAKLKLVSPSETIRFSMTY